MALTGTAWAVEFIICLSHCISNVSWVLSIIGFLYFIFGLKSSKRFKTLGMLFTIFMCIWFFWLNTAKIIHWDFRMICGRKFVQSLRLSLMVNATMCIWWFIRLKWLFLVWWIARRRAKSLLRKECIRLLKSSYGGNIWSPRFCG